MIEKSRKSNQKQSNANTNVFAGSSFAAGVDFGRSPVAGFGFAPTLAVAY